MAERALESSKSPGSQSLKITGFTCGYHLFWYRMKKLRDVLNLTFNDMTRSFIHRYSREIEFSSPVRCREFLGEKLLEENQTSSRSKNTTLTCNTFKQGKNWEKTGKSSVKNKLDTWMLTVRLAHEIPYFFRPLLKVDILVLRIYIYILYTHP